MSEIRTASPELQEGLCDIVKYGAAFQEALFDIIMEAHQREDRYLVAACLCTYVSMRLYHPIIIEALARYDIDESRVEGIREFKQPEQSKFAAVDKISGAYTETAMELIKGGNVNTRLDGVLMDGSEPGKDSAIGKEIKQTFRVGHDYVYSMAKTQKAAIDAGDMHVAIVAMNSIQVMDNTLNVIIDSLARYSINDIE